jgi:hypothetical protein
MIHTFESFVNSRVDEKKGVAPAIYSHLEAFFKEHKDGSYEDAKEYIKSKADGWDLSKEDYEEMKNK